MPTPIRAGDLDRPRRVRRPAAGFVAAAVAVALGVGGLVAGARGQVDGSPPAAAPADPAAAGGTAVGDVTVTGVYIRQPAAPDVAAAYLSIRNAGSEPDALESAYCGAARKTLLHGQPGVVEPGAHTDSGPVPVPANGSVTLAPGRGHIMLEGLTGTLRPGDEVSLLLRFARAGQVLVEAPVIAIGAPAPGGATS
ncbi:MAG: copper chaperone PCu(A)C [Mycobacteriales bacterium]